MAILIFTVPFRVCDQPLDPVLVEEDDSPLWLLRFATEQNIIDNGLDVTLIRTPSKVSQVTADSHLYNMSPATSSAQFELLHSRFSDNFVGMCGEVGSAYESVMYRYQRKGALLAVTDLVIAAKRALQLNFSYEQQMSTPACQVHVTIDYGKGAILKFTTTLSMDFTDPKRFDTADVRGLQRLAALDPSFPPIGDDKRHSSPMPEVQSYEDASDIVGDLGTRPLSRIHEPTSLDPLEDFRMPALDQDVCLNDAALMVTVAPTDKYTALASMILNMRRPDHHVVIVGDHPGTLAQALIVRNVPVVGIDPANTATIKPALGRIASYQTIAASLAFSDNEIVFRDKTGNPVPVTPSSLIVFDTSLDTETAESATTRNLMAGRLYKMKHPHAIVISQTRATFAVPGTYAVLDLPGHSGQGCEAYVVHCSDKQPNFGYNAMPWFAFAWALVCAEPADPDQDEMHLDNHDQFRFQISPRIANQDTGLESVFQAFFQEASEPIALMPFVYTGRLATARAATHEYQTPITRVAANRFWYHLIASRTFIYAHRARAFGPTSLVAGASDPVHLLTLLEHYFRHEMDMKPALANKFDPQVPEALTGVAPGLLKRQPRFRDLIKARYESLVAMTEFSEVATPDVLMTMMCEPGAGILLRGLSAVRALSSDVNWKGPLLGLYKRVLPYELMAILASRPFFEAIRHYVYACKVGLGKPMHAWELQHLLWTLTNHGTDAERMEYLGIKLRNALLPASRGRRLPSLITSNDHVLVNFETCLQQLGIFAAYLLFDKEHDKQAAAVFALTRGKQEQVFRSDVRAAAIKKHVATGGGVPLPALSATPRSMKHDHKRHSSSSTVTANYKNATRNITSGTYG